MSNEPCCVAAPLLPLSTSSTSTSTGTDSLVMTSSAAQGTSSKVTSASSKDSPHDDPLNLSPGHQGDKSAGGMQTIMRVLYCTNIDLSIDYDCLHVIITHNEGEE